MRFKLTVAFLAILILSTATFAQTREVPRSPDRAEGEGPFSKLILHGAILIDGTGAPPIGPMQITIEKNIITQIRSVGNPGLPMRPAPEAKPGEKVLDLSGKYIMPGIIDSHVHSGGMGQGTTAEYVFKLWMAHGITSVREVSAGNGLEWTATHSTRSAKNEITAPRIFTYKAVGADTPEEGRERVREAKKGGAVGLKLFANPPEVFEAIFDEAKKLGLRTAAHQGQMQVSRLNMLDLARMGLTSMEHWYGLPEALFDDRTVQDFPVDYNYNNEQDRFGNAGRLWKQAAKPYSEKWNAVMNELIELDFTLSPTLTIYEASRDLMRARRAEWHEEYTLPSLWRFYAPNRNSHGSYWFYWTTKDEIEWKNNYRLWMAFINEYKNRGGRVTSGSDSGFIYKLYGFGTIRELELLQEAGFHPLEVVRSATMYGAEVLGEEATLGSVEVGKIADLLVVDENPLENFKVLYGTGAIKIDENNNPIRVGGVRYTIKDGIIYDAKQLLADVAKMVRDAKVAESYEIVQPGNKIKK